MAKTTQTCDECKEIVRKPYLTLGVFPERKLCKKCFYEWCGLNEEGETK
jgi:formylmethanofuran dehydrogenase subunit E